MQHLKRSFVFKLWKKLYQAQLDGDSSWIDKLSHQHRADDMTIHAYYILCWNDGSYIKLPILNVDSANIYWYKIIGGNVEHYWFSKPWTINLTDKNKLDYVNMPRVK